jgi:hypothetical protein
MPDTEVTAEWTGIGRFKALLSFTVPESEWRKEPYIAFRIGLRELGPHTMLRSKGVLYIYLPDDDIPHFPLALYERFKQKWSCYLAKGRRNGLSKTGFRRRR